MFEFILNNLILVIGGSILICFVITVFVLKKWRKISKFSKPVSRSGKNKYTENLEKGTSVPELRDDFDDMFSESYEQRFSSSLEEFFSEKPLPENIEIDFYEH